MSRLWMTTLSDLRKGTGKGASERAELQCNWGSASDSKLAAKIIIEWNKGDKLPKVYTQYGSVLLPQLQGELNEFK